MKTLKKGTNWKIFGPKLVLKGENKKSSSAPFLTLLGKICKCVYWLLFNQYPIKLAIPISFGLFFLHKYG